MDWILNLVAWANANPSLGALATIAGLGAFMKLIVVPFVKYLASTANFQIVGKYTVAVCVCISVAIAEVAGCVTDGFTLTVIMKMLAMGLSAGFTAMGMQQTITALIRPDKM